MLDLMSTNEDYMIENVRSIAPLGKSNHDGLLWIFMTYSAIDARLKDNGATVVACGWFYVGSTN